uniref:NADH-ubiquinone oxidoreductase chain 2 n=1 Tax=Octostigma sinensis TaxID=211997 RepID=U3KTL1_9HEXA|nr:NADH dehydrogenase subunit 2 [Octostigma sinensis]AEV44834.1 NADH dehydrogenase subunit 2 [Octostigma sinensis]
MMIQPFKALFFLTLILGSMLTLSSPSWFIMWLGLEINLMSFIPIILENNNQRSTEASLKYFVVQASGSTLILFSAVSLLLKNYPLSPPSFLQTSYILLLSLAAILKMGAAPLHFWFPGTAEGMSWLNCMTLMTWQKLAPMIFLSYMPLSSAVILSILLSSFFGSIGGLNQTLMRKIMAYSSINHMSWMLLSIHLSMKIWTSYFLIYSLISISFMLFMLKNKIFHLSNLFFKKTNYQKFNCSLLLLSLGGLPPLLGFFPKWMVINKATSFSMFLTTFIILFTLISIFFYIRMIFSSTMLNYMNKKQMTLVSPNNTTEILSILFSIIGTAVSMKIFFF